MNQIKLKISSALLMGLLYVMAFPSIADTFKAKLEWSGRVSLSPLVKGYINEINVYPGDRVKKDDVLLRLAPEAYQAKVDHFLAVLKSNKSIMEEAKRELNRSEELYERTLLSDHDLQVDKNAFVSANAHYQSTIAQLKNARIDLENSINRAPFDAVVISRNAEIGQSVFPDFQPQAFLVIAEDNIMLAQAWLTEEQANKITQDQNVVIKVKGNTHKGKISFVGLEPKSSKEQLYKLVVRFGTNGTLYRAGIAAEIVTGDL